MAFIITKRDRLFEFHVFDRARRDDGGERAGFGVDNDFRDDRGVDDVLRSTFELTADTELFHGCLSDLDFPGSPTRTTWSSVT